MRETGTTCLLKLLRSCAELVTSRGGMSGSRTNADLEPSSSCSARGGEATETRAERTGLERRQYCTRTHECVPSGGASAPRPSVRPAARNRRVDRASARCRRSWTVARALDPSSCILTSCSSARVLWSMWKNVSRTSTHNCAPYVAPASAERNFWKYSNIFCRFCIDSSLFDELSVSKNSFQNP